MVNYDHFKRYKDVRSELVIGELSDMSHPVITIAIPTYKRPELLKEAIRSAINQVDFNFNYEIIVVDNEEYDCIETDTEKVVRSFTNEKLLYYKNEKNLGMAGNWNRCFELARSQWVALLHDDDLLKPFYLNNIYKLIRRKDNVGAIYTTYDIIDEHNVVKSDLKIKPTDNFKHNKMIKINPFDTEIQNGNVYGVPSCGTIYNKKNVMETGGFNEEEYPSMDWLFAYKFNKKFNVYRTLDLLGSYRILDNESFKIDTIKKFIINEFEFFKHNKNNNLLNQLIFNVFKYEQHIVSLSWALKWDKENKLKVNDFDFLCEYKVRPIRLYLYKLLKKIFSATKYVWTLIFG